MKLLLASLVLAIGCADVEDDLGEVQSASTPVGGQGSWYNGSWYNGSTFNGSWYNGSWYNGSWYNSTTYGGTTLPDAASIQDGTALVIWTKKGGSWEQRFPDKICTWNVKRTKLNGCTTVDIKKNPSPLAGTGFTAQFTKPDGTTITGKLYIGTATPTVGAVARDTTSAMHALTGASTAPLIGYGTSDATGAVCGNAHGCRVNSDIWLYSLKLWDPTTSAYLDFCRDGVQATALAGTYDTTGERIPSTTSFTFACSNGTIEKCVRWGYRPWASAQKYCDRTGGCTSPATDTALHPLADYHQACVRAATADYCGTSDTDGIGNSFTKNGTIVDIYDYKPNKDSWGFLPAARTAVPGALGGVTGVMWEASFDKDGAFVVDHTRYAEQSGIFGTVDNYCGGVFQNVGSSDDVTCPYGSAGGGCLMRFGGPGLPQGSTAIVEIDSAPSCAHSEFLVGKFLHSKCSSCTLRLHNNAATSYCTNATDSRGWDQNCVDQAATLCPAYERMTAHSECSAGAAMGAYSSGCTLAVCMDPAFAYCCSTGWDSACTGAANSSRCTFGKKGTCSGVSCFVGLCMSQPTTNGQNAP